MHVAVTGGTGFVGTHLVEHLLEGGHEVTALARGETGSADRLQAMAARVGRQDALGIETGSVTDGDAVAAAFEDAAAVAHLAGINFERGTQTYRRVHVEGTRTVLDAAESAGVGHLALTSYLRARPDAGSGYLESKWASEELVRESDLSTTVCKAGIVFGPGDQMVTQLARSIRTMPLFPGVGFRERELRPVAVDDLVAVLAAALVEHRLTDGTVAPVGPEVVTLEGAVHRVATALGRRAVVIPAPVTGLRGLAWVQERTMTRPAISRAALRMLAEGACDPAPAHVCEPLPRELQPDTPFDVVAIEASLPEAGRYGPRDLRWIG